MDFGNVVVNGKTYSVDEVYDRVLLVEGAEPTDFEDYVYINVAVKHRNKKADAGGGFQSLYRYDDLSDLSKFHAHEYPYYLKVKMTTVTDKNDKQIQQILWADFANVQEMELVPRNNTKKSSTQTKS